MKPTYAIFTASREGFNDSICATTDKEVYLSLLLLEALELIWYMEQGYSMQGKAKEFMKKCNYDFYNRDPKFIK